MPNDLIDALHRADLDDGTLLRIAHCYATGTDDLHERASRMLAVLTPRIAECVGDHERAAALLAEVLWVVA